MNAFSIRVETNSEYTTLCREFTLREFKLALISTSQGEFDRFSQVLSRYGYLVWCCILALNSFESKRCDISANDWKVGAAETYIVNVVSSSVVTTACALKAEGHKEGVSNGLVGEVDVIFKPFTALVLCRRHCETANGTDVHLTISEIDVAELELVCLLVCQIVTANAEGENLWSSILKVKGRRNEHHLSFCLVTVLYLRVVSRYLCYVFASWLVRIAERIVPPSTCALCSNVLPTVNSERLILLTLIKVFVEQCCGVRRIERKEVTLSRFVRRCIVRSYTLNRNV